MPLSPDQVAAALALLMPGFVWMKVFYFFGLRTRKTDAQWYMWAILLSAPFAGFVSVAHPPGPELATLLLAVVYGLVGGGLSVLLWTWALPAVWPSLRVRSTVGAWDAVFGQPGNRWIQVQTMDGRVLSGWAKYVGQLADTDDPDLFLADAADVVEGEAKVLEGVEGFLLRRSTISSLVVLAPGAELDKAVGARRA
jgi:Family of unknown function (DUF6338)